MLEVVGTDARSFALVYKDARGEARPTIKLEKLSGDARKFAGMYQGA